MLNTLLFTHKAMSETTSQEILKGIFTTDKATLLQIVKSVNCLVEDVTIKMTNEGLLIRTMDVSHVALIDIRLPDIVFEKYNIFAGEKEINAELIFALHLDEFSKLVSSLDKKGSIKIEVRPNDKLILSQNGFTSETKLIETTSVDCPLPKISYDTVINFGKDETQAFFKTLKKLGTQSDYITLNSIDKILEISGNGDNGKASIKMNELIFDRSEDAKTTYSLEYLTPFLKSLQKDSEIDVMFSTVKPIRISTRINNISCVDFYLAPRVEN